MKKMFFIALFATSSLFAHTALMSCFDNGDGSVTCEGGFSDGSSASGINFLVLQNGNVIESGKMDGHSEYTFDKPEGDYEAVFDAGEGHKVIVKSSDIAL
ncbi:MAG: hypothetical protein M0P02_02035 [Sulfurospirillaceae bacterium]|jgi:hypothetical protein|nr:hypothetical protein [Sulfurospirillaceae bacterium]MCK9545847.1 hypothetical protein [Sulfurospirillaceae bacterium]MDY0237906.1 hypothetical protein [Campylobacterales bacterium]NLM99008.1 hypothetical protein [Campylobacteraceae bacterium]